MKARKRDMSVRQEEVEAQAFVIHLYTTIGDGVRYYLHMYCDQTCSILMIQPQSKHSTVFPRDIMSCLLFDFDPSSSPASGSYSCSSLRDGSSV
jgi:hypothetical protein